MIDSTFRTMCLAWLLAAAGCHGPTARFDGPLHAALWIHTSAEYDALCRQTFHAALEYVTQEAAARRAKGGAPPLAIVMDLDETVFDNTAYNFRLAARGEQSTGAKWNAWVRDHDDEVTLVPGAKSFIEAVRALGVDVVFISNRRDEVFEPTLASLKHLGIVPAEAAPMKYRDAVVYLRKGDRSKQGRRDLVEARYRDATGKAASGVLAYLGDSLADMDVYFERARGEDLRVRRSHVENAAKRWGAGWFVLPNPMYGDWEHVLTDEDVDKLLDVG